MSWLPSRTFSQISHRRRIPVNPSGGFGNECEHEHTSQCCPQNQHDVIAGDARVRPQSAGGVTSHIRGAFPASGRAPSPSARSGVQSLVVSSSNRDAAFPADAREAAEETSARTGASPGVGGSSIVPVHDGRRGPRWRLQ